MQLVILQSAGNEAAATALALLTSKSSSMAAACTSIPQCQPALLCLLKHSTPATRLAACICLRNICSAVDADDSNHGSKSEVKLQSTSTTGSAAAVQSPCCLVFQYQSVACLRLTDAGHLVVLQSAYRAMLPVLLKLLHMPTGLDQVPQVLTDLLQQSPAMQKAANDSDAVSSLTTILHHEHTWHNRPRFKASILGSAFAFPNCAASTVSLLTFSIQ